MVSTTNANATTETARHSVPLSAGPSTKAHTTPLHPPKAIYARVSPPQQAQVPPPSTFTRQYAEVRSFRGWYTHVSATAVAGDPLDNFFSEVKELEAAHRARRADPYKTASREEDGEDSTQEEASEDDGDDEGEEFLDVLEWREEALESDVARTTDEAGARTDAVHRAPSSVVVVPAEDNDYCIRHHV